MERPPWPATEQDSLEPRQIVAARERLAPFRLDIRRCRGGHLMTSERPLRLADAIRELAVSHGVGEPFTTQPPANR